MKKMNNQLTKISIQKYILQKKNYKSINKRDSRKFKSKIIELKRVVKVTKGEKKLTFRVVIILGDLKKQVALGVGRAADTNLAFQKAIINGKKNLIQMPLTKHFSIARPITVKFGAANVMIRPARIGTGIIAGGVARSILELGGFQNVRSKQYGSTNILNNAKATLLALYKLKFSVPKKNYNYAI